MKFDKAIFASFILVVLSSCAKSGTHMPLAVAEKPVPQSQGCSEGDLTYQKDILSVLQKKCQMCHQSGPLNWMEYGNFKSKLMAVNDRVFLKQDMPPRGLPALTATELSTLKRWMDIGAPEKNMPCESEGTSTTSTSTTTTTLPEVVTTTTTTLLEISTTTTTLPISEPPSVGYEEDIIPLVQAKCALCHGDGMDSLGTNWLKYEQIVLKKSQLIDRVFIKKDMPMAGMPELSLEEKETLKNWIDQGMAKTRQQVKP